MFISVIIFDIEFYKMVILNNIEAGGKVLETAKPCILKWQHPEGLVLTPSISRLGPSAIATAAELQVVQDTGS
jgi:hypothetical protein